MANNRIKELRIAGRLDEALELAQSEFNASPDNIWAKRNLGWVFYSYVCTSETISQWEVFISNIHAIKNLELPRGEEMLFDSLAWKIGKMIYALNRETEVNLEFVHDLMNCVFSFSFTKPSEAYSFLLKAFHKALKNSDQHNTFIDWWDLKNLRDEDFINDLLPDGREMISTAEMVYSTYAKNLLPKKKYSGEIQFDKAKALAFLPVLKSVDDGNPGFKYISYYRAKLLLVLGEKEETLSAFLPFARRKSKDFWIWELLGEVEKEDTDKMLACFCKGLNCPSPKEMLTNLRMKLCRILITKELYNEARTEIEEIVRVRTLNGYAVPSQVINWQQLNWYKGATRLISNYHYYKKHFKLAEDTLYGDIVEQKVIVESLNLGKKILNYFTADKTVGFFKYGDYIRNVNPGDVLSVRFRPKEEDRLQQVYTVWISQDIDFKNKYSKVVEGKVRIPEGKTFGFLDDIFISPKIVAQKNLKDGMLITGHAVKMYDTKKEKWVWKLVS